MARLALVAPIVVRSRIVLCLLPGEMPVENLCNILARREEYHLNDVLHELMSIETFHDAIDSCDKDALKELKKSAYVETEELRTFRRDLSSLRASVPSSSGRRKKVGAADQPKSRVYPKVLPEFSSSFTKEAFQALLPPGIRVTKEAFHGRWRLFWTGQRKSRSATWDLHGFEGSIRMLLSEAWADHTARTGAPCPFKLAQ